MKERLIIIGASGHGKVVADIAIKMNRWSNIAFLDDNTSIMTCLDLEVIGNTSDAFKYKDDSDFFVAIGNNMTRKKILSNIINSGMSITNIIHPSAVIGSDVEIGIGTVIMAGTVVNPSCKIGIGCIVNTGSSIDHDNMIKDYVHLSPGVRTAGAVTIEEGAWLGIGSVISNNLTICSDCKIGAGAVVITSITQPGTYVGVPVRRVVK